MLHTVSAITDQGVSLDLPFSDVGSGYVVKDITGLDPVPATLVSSSLARLDGEQYQSSRREKRNIVITLGIEPANGGLDVRGLRKALYNVFMPKKNVTLTFAMHGYSDLVIAGTIETFDSPIFAKEPTATISIICFDPDFYDPQEKQLAGSTTSGTTNLSVNYDGEIDTGFWLQMNVNRTLSGFTIINQAPGEAPTKLDFAASMLSGDVIRISTVPGNKYANLTRANAISSLLYGVSPYSDWIRFKEGTNLFRIVASGAAVPYTITYTDKYGGL